MWPLSSSVRISLPRFFYDNRSIFIFQTETRPGHEVKLHEYSSSDIRSIVQRQTRVSSVSQFSDWLIRILSDPIHSIKATQTWKFLQILRVQEQSLTMQEMGMETRRTPTRKKIYRLQKLLGGEAKGNLLCLVMLCVSSPPLCSLSTFQIWLFWYRTDRKSVV